MNRLAESVVHIVWMLDKWHMIFIWSSWLSTVMLLVGSSRRLYDWIALEEMAFANLLSFSWSQSTLSRRSCLLLCVTLLGLSILFSSSFHLYPLLPGQDMPSLPYLYWEIFERDNLGYLLKWTHWSSDLVTVSPGLRISNISSISIDINRTPMPHIDSTCNRCLN